MLPAALLLLAQSAPAVARAVFPGDQDAPAPATLVESPRARCAHWQREGEIVVCAEPQRDNRLADMAALDAFYAEKPVINPNFSAAGARGNVHATPHSTGARSAPAAMVTMRWHF